MKKLEFPKDFFWGTSTAAAQVETASNHPWKGLVAKDGYTFDRTTDHEKRRMEDAALITQLGNVYRCGVDWSRLQKGPFEPFDKDLVLEYQHFFRYLNEHGTRVMFVIHHFTNPNWFDDNGGWAKEENISPFVDYAKQCADHFGAYTFSWNIFNEPNVYALNGYVTGEFPPFKKNIFTASRVLKNMGKAHLVVYDILKDEYPEIPVGISFNTCYFKAKNPLGWLPAAFTDWWFHTYARKCFDAKMDYWGLSYYAYILFDPLPITELDRPGELAKLGLPHDKMWGYNPKGLERNLRRFHNWYGKPMVITENGICTDDSDRRIDSIKDYLTFCHQLIQEGIDLKGYVHWSTWDNFEWAIGPTYRFGLIRVDFETMERTMTKAGIFYQKVAEENGVEVS